MVKIEPYTRASPLIRAQLSEVFVRASEGSPGGELWGDSDSEAAVYLDPYMQLEPESLFLAVDGSSLLGYLAGCVDSTRFPKEGARIDMAIRQHRLFQKRGTRPFFLRAMRDGLGDRVRRLPPARDLEDPRWPSHLHINVLPHARGTGAADGLMTAWRDRLCSAESPGCHLQTQAENTRARRFFLRHGFAEHGASAPIPGVRVAGARVHQLTMVRASAFPVART